MTIIIILRLLYEAYWRFPHFKIVRVGVREWINKNTDHFFTYQIELKTKKASNELVFEELWIDEKKYKFHLSREHRNISGIFNKKETLKLNVGSEIKFESEPIENGKSSKGQLILGYTYKNKKKSIRFKKFRPMDDLRLTGTF